jgi:hypothetical protein
MNETVFRQVTALPNMTGKELIILWKNLFEKDPPSTNRGYLIKRLAYRIQEIAYGVDTHDLEERLDKLAKTKRCTVKTPYKPHVGTALVRTYQGVEHHVTVLSEGFEYKGARYRSLSQIARHITNTRWNGLVFFGLKRSGVKS